MYVYIYIYVYPLRLFGRGPYGLREPEEVPSLYLPLLFTPSPRSSPILPATDDTNAVCTSTCLRTCMYMYMSMLKQCTVRAYMRTSLCACTGGHNTQAVRCSFLSNYTVTQLRIGVDM